MHNSATWFRTLYSFSCALFDLGTKRTKFKKKKKKKKAQAYKNESSHIFFVLLLIFYNCHNLTMSNEVM